MITSLDKNTALLLIDLQKGIVRYSLAKPVGEIVENAAKLVAAFRKAELPIVLVTVNPAGAAWLKTRKMQRHDRTRLRQTGLKSRRKLKHNRKIFLLQNIPGEPSLKHR